MYILIYILVYLYYNFFYFSHLPFDNSFIYILVYLYYNGEVWADIIHNSDIYILVYLYYNSMDIIAEERNSFDLYSSLFILQRYTLC